MLCKVGRGWVEDFSWVWKCPHWVMRWYGVLLKNHISPRIGNQMVLPERTPFSTDFKIFFFFFPCKEQSLEFETTVLCSSMENNLAHPFVGSSPVWDGKNVFFQKISLCLPRASCQWSPLWNQKKMRSLADCSNLAFLVGFAWCQSSRLWAQGYFQAATEQRCHRVEFWPHSPFNQRQRLHFVGSIVQPGVKSISGAVEGRTLSCLSTLTVASWHSHVHYPLLQGLSLSLLSFSLSLSHFCPFPPFSPTLMSLSTSTFRDPKLREPSLIKYYDFAPNC